MPELSPDGRKAVAEIAGRTGFSVDAVTAMLAAVTAGRGGMAQFSHAEFGGSGQWMGGGAIMISDMFNNALKARVDALCNELAALVRRDPSFAGGGAFQSQSQGVGGPDGGSASGLFTSDPGQGAQWWPQDLGTPASVGAQNDVRYAYFPSTRRLAIDRGGKVTVYDTQDHQIGGFSQQQPGAGSFRFTSQSGPVDISRLPVVSCEREATPAPEPPSPAAGSGPSAMPAAGHDAILTAIERLADLHKRGVLTDEEFSATKAELLSRL
jgi:Short C-terminal domain